MGSAVEVAGAAADVRDVVETFRRYGLQPSAWEDTLRQALGQLPREYVDSEITPAIKGMVRDLQRLLEDGLEAGPTLDRLSATALQLLEVAQVEGIPAPNDQDWAFDQD